MILDWDDTLMPSSFLQKHVRVELDANTQTVSRCFVDARLQLNKSLLSRFIADLELVGAAALKLLQTTLSYFRGGSVKIVTNCRNGWVEQSLLLAMSLCLKSGVFHRIHALMEAHKMEVIYARNRCVEQSLWKTNVFNELMCAHFREFAHLRLNVLTVGDQWSDHQSVRQTTAWRMFGARLSHHQIKLFAEPDCRYLAMELRFVAEQMAQTNSNLRAWSGEGGIVLEFEGYN